MAETVISAALLMELKARAAATPDHEVCGLLLGGLDRIEAAEVAPNVAADPVRTFELDPRVLLRAYRAARAGGAQVIGHYHSHPSGSAIPSDRDRAAAEPGKLWLILAGDEARLWLAAVDDFSERAIRIV